MEAAVREQERAKAFREMQIIEQQAQAEKLTTNNKMELKAIIKGLECLSNQVTPMHEIYVYTDSQYVVNGMKTWIHGWKKRNWKKADNKAPENLELWQRLDEQSQICSVIFNWVKGHSGHPQNEYVDGLANKVLDENGF
ncbi:MAG: ribonuclease HI [Halobacteriovoraceae bacterium]|nr:ribonuclease HI [Halobacteriovoraceae bacterium]